MGIRNIEFLVQEAFVGIWRNGIMAVASLTTIALSLSILGAFILLILGAHNFVESELGKFDVAVFLDPDIKKPAEDKVLESIKAIPTVRNVKLISKEEAWPAFKKDRTTDIELGGIIKNPLPDALRVSVSDPKQTEEVAEKIRQMDGIHRVREARKELRRVIAVADFIKYVGVLAALVLLGTATFIISNAIRLTVYARRREIRIMQLVGATNWFIRIPLVVEGVVLGAVGGLIAAGFITMGRMYLSRVVERMMLLFSSVNSGIGSGELVTAMVITGALIGAAGSTVSIRKFLKN